VKLPRLRNARLERRLILASCAAAAAAVPVAVIGYAASHGWRPLRNLDGGVAEGLHSWAVSQPGAVGFLEGVSSVLSPWTLRGAALVVVTALFVRGQRRLAAWVGTTVVAGSVLGFSLKLIVARARPSLPDPVSSAIGSSFPSGHALNSFVILGVFVLLAIPQVPRAWHPVVWVAAGSTIALVGFARVSLGVHYVSDVVAGWLIGAGLIAGTVIAFDTWQRPERRAAAEILGEGVDPEASRAAAGQPNRQNAADPEVA